MDATIIFTETNAILDSKLSEIHDAAYLAFEYEVEGARFSKAFRAGKWNGKKSFYHRLYHSFPSGLTTTLAKHLTSLGYSVNIDDRRNPLKINASRHEIETCLNGVTLRDYQADAVERIFQKTCGIVRLPTGSGKTKLAIAAMKLALNKAEVRSLFLTHKKDLLHQTAKEIEACTGIKAGVIGDGRKEITEISVATIQTLNRALKDPQIKDFLKSIRMVICDECHHASAKTFKEVIEKCTSAYYRIGLTATPLMKNKFEDLQLIALTGEIIHLVAMTNLVDQAFLAQPLIKFIPIYEPVLPRRMDWREAYLAGIVHNERRNQTVANEAAIFAASGLSSLVLINELDQGENIARIMSKVYPGLRYRYISGDDSSQEREQAFREISNGTIQVLVSSTILDEGVDLPSVNAVVNAGGWKSRIKVYQKIGRGMRPKAGENVVYIVDFADMTQAHLTRHAIQRLSTVQKEEGFKIVNDFNLRVA